jgi:hypothetical protein
MLPDETFWVDTTDDVCRFGMLPPGDSGRKVLVISERANSLTQLPPPDPGRHKLTVRAHIDCTRGSDPLPTTFEVLAFGYPDYELRESSRAAREHSDAVPFLSHRYRISSGSFALQKQRATSAGALDQDFTWHAQGSLIGAYSYLPNKTTNSDRVTPSAKHASIRPSFWLPKEWDVALHQRKSALFLNQGYPLTLDEELEYTLPSGSPVVGLATPAEGQQGPLRWKLEWTRAADAKIRAVLHAELSRGELSAAETSSFQQALRALIIAVNAGITFDN